MHACKWFVHLFVWFLHTHCTYCRQALAQLELQVPRKAVEHCCWRCALLAQGSHRSSADLAYFAALILVAGLLQPQRIVVTVLLIISRVILQHPCLLQAQDSHTTLLSQWCCLSFAESFCSTHAYCTPETIIHRYCCTHDAVPAHTGTSKGQGTNCMLSHKAHFLLAFSAHYLGKRMTALPCPGCAAIGAASGMLTVHGSGVGGVLALAASCRGCCLLHHCSCHAEEPRLRGRLHGLLRLVAATLMPPV